jgi:DNA-binding IclR family transcriptional regulator
MPGVQIKVLDKAIQVIELLATSSKGLRLKDVGQSLALNKTTVLRILRVLESHRVVARNGDANFILGARMLWWETCYRRNFEPLSLVHSFLEKIRDLTSETVIFSIVTGNRTVIVNQVVSPHVTSSRYDLGAAAPVHAGASGKAILAFSDADKQKQLLHQGGLERLTERTVTCRKLLEKQLKEIRRSGFAVTRGERFPNTASMAVPVFGSHGKVIGAVAVIGPSERLTLKRLREIAPVVLKEAGVLTEQLRRATAGPQRMNVKKNLSADFGNEQSQISAIPKRPRTRRNKQLM